MGAASSHDGNSKQIPSSSFALPPESFRQVDPHSSSSRSRRLCERSAKEVAFFSQLKSGSPGVGGGESVRRSLEESLGGKSVVSPSSLWSLNCTETRHSPCGLSASALSPRKDQELAASDAPSAKEPRLAEAPSSLAGFTESGSCQSSQLRRRRWKLTFRSSGRSSLVSGANPRTKSTPPSASSSVVAASECKESEKDAQSKALAQFIRLEEEEAAQRREKGGASKPSSRRAPALTEVTTTVGSSSYASAPLETRTLTSIPSDCFFPARFEATEETECTDGGKESRRLLPSEKELPQLRVTPSEVPSSAASASLASVQGTRRQTLLCEVPSCLVSTSRDSTTESCSTESCVQRSGAVSLSPAATRLPTPNFRQTQQCLVAKSPQKWIVEAPPDGRWEVERGRWIRQGLHSRDLYKNPNRPRGAASPAFQMQSACSSLARNSETRNALTPPPPRRLSLLPTGLACVLDERQGKASLTQVKTIQAGVKTIQAGVGGVGGGDRRERGTALCAPMTYRGVEAATTIELAKRRQARLSHGSPVFLKPCEVSPEPACRRREGESVLRRTSVKEDRSEQPPPPSCLYEALRRREEGEPKKYKERIDEENSPKATEVNQPTSRGRQHLPQIARLAREETASPISASASGRLGYAPLLWPRGEGRRAFVQKPKTNMGGLNRRRLRVPP